MATIEIPGFVVDIIREFDMSDSVVAEMEVCESLRLPDHEDALEDQSVVTAGTKNKMRAKGFRNVPRISGSEEGLC